MPLCFFDDGSVTGDRYINVLRYFLFQKVANYFFDMIFLQDGTPLQYVILVRAYLDRKLPKRWMGRGGPISWSTQSPDLTHATSFSRFF